MFRERLRLRQEALRQQKSGGAVPASTSFVDTALLDTSKQQLDMSAISTVSSVVPVSNATDSSFNDVSVSSSNVSMTDDSFDQSTLTSGGVARSKRGVVSNQDPISRNGSMQVRVGTTRDVMTLSNDDSNAVMSFEELDDSYDG